MKEKTTYEIEMTVEEFMDAIKGFEGKTLYAVGGFCEKLTQSKLDQKAKQYPNWYYNTKCAVAGYRPCFIEGHNIDDIAAIYSLAQCLTSRIYEANQHDRERLHIAGVFANNYSNLMYRIAADVLKGTQIPFEALLPLIDQTAAKVHSLAPKDAQTGPAQRGDEAVIKHHLEILKTTPYGEVYQALAALIEKEQNR